MVILGIVLCVVGALAGVVAMMFCAGFFISREHNASVRVALTHAPADVWKEISDFERAVEWRPGLKKVERLPDEGGKPRWKETSDMGVMTLEVSEQEQPRRMVTTIADKDLPFGGRWVYELAPENGGTVMTITEEGEIYPPPFRFMSKFFFGYHSTLVGYEKALAKRLGEEAEPAIVD